jgi:hypothetical protein
MNIDISHLPHCSVEWCGAECPVPFEGWYIPCLGAVGERSPGAMRRSMKRHHEGLTPEQIGEQLQHALTLRGAGELPPDFPVRAYSGMGMTIAHMARSIRLGRVEDV